MRTLTDLVVVGGAALILMASGAVLVLLYLGECAP